MEINKELGKKLEKVLDAGKWRYYVSGKVEGGLLVLMTLGIEKEKGIETLAKALGLSRETATEFVNDFHNKLNQKDMEEP